MAMRVLTDRQEVRAACSRLLERLEEGTRPVGGAGAKSARPAWNPVMHFWFSRKSGPSGLLIQAGAEHPGVTPSGGKPPLHDVELDIPFAGFDQRRNACFLHFGGDLLLACLTRPGDDHFTQFLDLHGYGLSVVEVQTPRDRSVRAVVVSGLSSPSLPFDFSRFVSAWRDFNQWRAQDLLPGSAASPVFGPSVTARREPVCEEGGPGGHPFKDLVLQGVREHLAKYARGRGLKVQFGASPASDILMAGQQGTVLAAFQVLTSLAPAGLQAAIGQLLLSRLTLRAAKFLVLPGVLGPFFRQALFKHDIHVATYKLTQDMAVVLDAQAVFEAITPPD